MSDPDRPTEQDPTDVTHLAEATGDAIGPEKPDAGHEFDGSSDDGGKVGQVGSGAENQGGTGLNRVGSVGRMVARNTEGANLPRAIEIICDDVSSLLPIEEVPPMAMDAARSTDLDLPIYPIAAGPRLATPKPAPKPSSESVAEIAEPGRYLVRVYDSEPVGLPGLAHRTRTGAWHLWTRIEPG